MQPSLALEDVETAAIEGECAVAQPGGGVLRLRYRWEPDGGATPHEGELLPTGTTTLEVWKNRTREWVPVRNLNSRDWFTVGLVIGAGKP